ncbi:hypothetical protein D9M68_737350 [compost metagenome]
MPARFAFKCLEAGAKDLIEEFEYFFDKFQDSDLVGFELDVEPMVLGSEFVEVDAYSESSRLVFAISSCSFFLKS